MSYLTRMVYYVSVDPRDGLYHVQNMVAGNLGQHHVHTLSGFQKWTRENNISLNEMEGWLTKKGYPREGGGFRREKCDCGLEAGQVSSGGKVHTNPRYI